jgi:hypothetical protein
MHGQSATRGAWRARGAIREPSGTPCQARAPKRDDLIGYGRMNSRQEDTDQKASCDPVPRLASSPDNAFSDDKALRRLMRQRSQVTTQKRRF